MSAYYNEIDPYAAEWLRNLILAGRIAPGYVDERSIEDVRPDDLREFKQCHFFAGVGVWSYALRLAGWPDDKPVWTGSCPCQPFSAAGKGGGFADERHLWPAWYHLITQCEPGVVFGEQVASKDGLGWLDLVQADLEGAGYAAGAVDLCAAGVGAPHIRQRSWFVAERLADPIGTGQRLVGRGWLHSEGKARPHVDDVLEVSGLADPHSGQQQGQSVIPRAGSDRQNPGRTKSGGEFGPHGDLCGLENSRRSRPGHTDSAASEQGRDSVAGWGAGLRQGNRPPMSDRKYANGDLSGLADTELCGREREPIFDAAGLLGALDEQREPREPVSAHSAAPHRAPPTGPTNGLWGDADWLYCRDGKWRPVEPGTFPLANGAPSRVGRLRAYGNAINAKAAEEFIRVYLNDAL